MLQQDRHDENADIVKKNQERAAPEPARESMLALAKKRVGDVTAVELTPR